MEIWETSFDDDNYRRKNRGKTKKPICPRCGKRSPFLYVKIIKGNLDMNVDSYKDSIIYTYPLRHFVLCRECGKIIFPEPNDETRYEVEFEEKGYNHTFIDLKDVPEDIKSLFTRLFEEVKRCSELCKQYYGTIDDIPERDWIRMFGLNASDTPGVSIGEDIAHIFLDNGSVHVANNNGKISILVVYEKNVKDTLEELRRPEVMKLIENVLSYLKRENSRIEMHIAVEKMIE